MEDMDMVIKKLSEHKKRLLKIVKQTPVDLIQKEAIMEAQNHLDQIRQLLEHFCEK